jgi:GDP-4-dehydro-6-deoxy-D-mannose reductase
MVGVLVTGAEGFVGRHLVVELAAHGHEVVATIGPGGRPSFAVDLLDAGAVAALDLTGVDAIVHLAGLASVGPSFSAPLTYVTSNMGIEINLLEAALAQQRSIRALIISSGSLYDGRGIQPLTEDSAVRPDSPYAVSKLGQEHLGAYYGTRGLEVLVARPFNHIGPGQGPGFLVPDLARQVVAVERRESTSVSVGNLESHRDYTDVRDIARAYRLLLEAGTTGSTYNVCSGTSHGGQEVLELLLKLSPASPKVVSDPSRMRPSDTPRIVGSSAKLQRDTGWRPQIALATSLADALEDWRSRSA